MSEFTEMWRVKHDEPLNYNERIVNNACDLIEELEGHVQQLIWIAEKADTDDSEDTTIELAKQALKPRT